MSTPTQSVLLVLLAGLIGSFGAVLLKFGAGRLHRQLSTLLLNWRLAAGVALYLLSFVFYFLAVRQGELSVLYPMVALGYIWTMFWSRLFFGEPLTRRKAGGVLLILAGVAMLNLRG